MIAAANAQGLTRPIDDDYADSMLAFTDAMGDYRPSMQIDREERRALETAAILRIPAALGMERGVGMPRVEMLAVLLEQAVDAGRCQGALSVVNHGETRT